MAVRTRARQYGEPFETEDPFAEGRPRLRPRYGPPSAPVKSAPSSGGGGGSPQFLRAMLGAGGPRGLDVIRENFNPRGALLGLFGTPGAVRGGLFGAAGSNPVGAGAAQGGLLGALLAGRGRGMQRDEPGGYFGPSKRIMPGSGRRPQAEESVGIDYGPATYDRTLDDFMALAERYIQQRVQQELNGVANQENALRTNADQIRGELRGGYSGLGNFIKGQDPILKDIFSESADAIGAASQQAQREITQGNSAAQAAQQAILSRLGIQDANISIANRGNTLEEGAAQAVADSAARGQAATTRVNENMANARSYNTSSGTAAAAEGQQQQNRINRDLLSRLAELADLRSAIQQQSQTDTIGLAQQLMNQDYDLWQGNYDRRYQLDQDAMGYAMEQAEMAAEAQGQGGLPEISGPQWSALGPAGQAAYALEQSGIPRQQAASIMQEITTLMGDGKIRNPAKFIAEIQRIARERGLNPVDTANAASIYFQYFK